MVEDKELTFANEIFQNIIGKDKFEKIKQQIINLRLFKVFSETEDHEGNDGSKVSYVSFHNDELLTVSDLISKQPRFFKNKVFQIMETAADSEEESAFKYVQIKVQRVKQSSQKNKNKFIIQLIDVSARMLYTEIKAQKEFLTLINATVSHELRNPLASLNSQIQLLGVCAKGLLQMFQTAVVGEQITTEMKTQAQKIVEGIQTCTHKISSAGKFIDFFVHDILDYTVLSRNAANFVKNMQVFHAKACVQEIVDILRDKIDMKRNQIETLFQGFDIAQKFYVKTDQKRLQQVLLNLVSNAVKFTDGGTIAITFEVDSDRQLRIQVRDTGIGIRP